MLNIVYMGTPSFAVAPLEALLSSGHQISAVVTSPDKPAGRGRKLTSSEVKTCALRHDLPLLQPTSLKDGAFINILKSIQPDVIVVVAFRMLPVHVWKIPRLGTLNLHASLLPKYRGAAPINHAIIQGETQSGLTTFLINEEIDTGDILMQETIDIEPEETFGSLHDRMMVQGSSLLVRTLSAIESGNIHPLQQDSIGLPPTPAPKLSKSNTRIDWKCKAERIVHLIRGLSPTPGAWTMLKASDGSEHQIKIFKAQANSHSNSSEVGRVFTEDKKRLFITCGNNETVEIHSLQLAGRGIMNAGDFMRGYETMVLGSIME